MAQVDAFPDPDLDFPLDAQIAAVQRELYYRERVYAGLVADGRMNRAKADYQVGVMTAVLQTLEELRRELKRSGSC